MSGGSKQPIDPRSISSLLPRLVTASQSPSDLIAECMNALTTIGFDSSRYYERDEDPDRGPIYVLTHQQPHFDLAYHGYTIPEAETALHQIGGGRRVTVAVHEELHPTPSWVSELQLDDRVSIDIPVVSGGHLLGLLAADCDAGRIIADRDALELLLALGAIAGSASLAAQAGVDDPVELRHIPQTSESPDDYAVRAATELMGISDASLGALFRLDWRRDELVKVHHWRDGEEQPLGDFPETYRIGSNLTGEAWRDEKWRYVPDLNALMNGHPELVDRGSYDYHAQQLGDPLKTALYAIIGRQEPRYLVRVFNRRSDPKLPFLGTRGRFESLARLHSVAFDDLVARRRLDHVARTARSGVQNLLRPATVLEDGLPGLIDEGITDFVFVCKLDGSQHPVLSSALGLYEPDLELLERSILPTSETLMSLAGQQGRIVPIEHIERAIPHVGALLRSARQRSGVPEQFACFSARSGDVTGILFARIRADARKRAAQVAFATPALDAASVLVSLFTEAVDSKFSYLSARGARQALGYIGHELGTPLSILGDAAVAAVMGTLDEIDMTENFTPERKALLRTRLRALYARVQDARGASNSALRLAPLVVQAGEGRLPLFLEPERVGDIVEAAAKQVAYETQGRQAKIQSRKTKSEKFRIDINQSVHDLGRINCDTFLLRQLLVNVIGNAVKYSTVRRPGEDMIVSVSGQLSGPNVLISVQNWGELILQENEGQIFEAFVRGEMEARFSATSGMGLGLYVSRLIAAAHSGSLDLRGARRTSQSETPLYEGPSEGLTTFDLRIPRALPEGAFRFSWLDGRGTLKEGY